MNPGERSPGSRPAGGGRPGAGESPRRSGGIGSALLPTALPGRTLWSRALVAAFVALGLFFADRLTVLLADYWFLESLGRESVFWTNVRMGALLFGSGFLVFCAAVAGPALLQGVGGGRRRLFVGAGVLVGLLAGYLLCLQYRDFLVLVGGRPFGRTDPLFGNDIGFYVFTLPSLWTIWTALFWALLAALVSSAWAAWLTRPHPADPALGRIPRVLGSVSSRTTLAALAALDLLLAAGVWLRRYDLLWKDNADSAVHSGAAYLDVTGFFSSLNGIYVLALAIVADTVGLVVVLTWLRRALGRRRPERADSPLAATPFSLRRAALLLLVPVALDVSFQAAVGLRDLTTVRPNEPAIQIAYIDRHIRSTLSGYDLDRVETVRFVPSGEGDPLPDVDSLLASPTLRNAPLWPGFVSKLEKLIDPQHADRVLLTGGNETVYGPTQEIFRQQQRLRTYYDFMDVDAVRYRVDGEPRMFASAVREIPLVEPQEWLAWWGQRFVLFTHGFGLVMAPTGEASSEGEPTYASAGVPPRTDIAPVAAANPRIYYGEGAASMAYTNVRRLKEFDYPTDEGRAEMELPPDVRSGVHLDSFLKRLVFGWRSRQFFEIVFSDLIGAETRVHYYRTPLGRLGRLAPFLYFDTDPWAVAAGGRVLWMANGLTHTDRYPYSRRQWLGDKSDERSPQPGDLRRVNYVRDAVKATVDAYTGQIRLFKISDDPIVETWDRVYPDLFEHGDEMPADVRRHLQYPVQLFHIQFDDIYNLYHMTDPMTFFNMEDAWDDADEVLGPIIDKGRAITFSTEPHHWIAVTGGALPAADPETQFAMGMAFTPEKSLNLRAFAVAYQDGRDYGRLVVLRVPKGLFRYGPEQADAAIDQQPLISQQITWWNRLGSDVIRGHTTTLVVGDELIYLEPFFNRSQQNPTTQLKRVVAVVRGRAGMGRNLDEALRVALGQRQADELLPAGRLPAPPPAAASRGRPPQAPGASEDAAHGSDSGSR